MERFRPTPKEAQEGRGGGQEHQKPIVSVREAERRIATGTDQLETSINNIDRTPGRTDKKRRAKIESIIGSFIFGRETVVPPSPRKRTP